MTRLRSRRRVDQVRAADALGQREAAGHGPDIIAAGAVPPLVERLRSDSTAMQQAAVGALAQVVACSPGGFQAAVGHGAAAASVHWSSCCTPDSPQLRQQAEGALRWLTAEPQATAPKACAAEGGGATRGLHRCGGCGKVRYCSKACSRAHWRTHKAECRRLQAERAGGAERASGRGGTAE